MFFRREDAKERTNSDTTLETTTKHTAIKQKQFGKEENGRKMMATDVHRRQLGGGGGGSHRPSIKFQLFSSSANSSSTKNHAGRNQMNHLNISNNNNNINNNYNNVSNSVYNPTTNTMKETTATTTGRAQSPMVLVNYSGFRT